ncbi:tRNA (N6-threonylcarbamoyladenosine(37)-N6)-methyltransferase TrmO [Neptuniibacter sp.]|uniref:tRNA (N6-threonylcarbamoyladenosine(37)-N6)-methyltransferase TrmO n=1 Tax=Neptuniibacter sp. TaxID=1962643 RepID=UPI00260302CB|nr:tRNA (N6-threonylcarbamoyladenosine(37)-N6)-methyltransferase TrmO [Neptuniibacter sp.]MCP4598077.1 tRNA (N6-threonylcarbamoyladenosine(37)-N6)-methyltransferase TrmO [Neptuniibacter sp.]
MSTSFSLETVAKIKSPYKEKFGIPRQPGLAESLISRVQLLGEYANPEMARGLEQCTHIWLLFIFSECVDKGWKPTVRPPRLGGNKRMGVFSTRSPFRPNPIGMSPVKLIAIEQQGSAIELVISGADLLDGTPIIDIKPYLPYSDIIPEAECSFAPNIQLLPQSVKFSSTALEACKTIEKDIQQPVQQQITELLKCDPRPAYKKNNPDHSYGVTLHNANIRFRITDAEIIVDNIELQVGTQV